MIKFASSRGLHPNVQYNLTPCRGGLDQVTPTLSLPPGFVRDSVNFEVATSKAGGYTRIAGYERFDGHAKPSDADIGLVQVSSFTNVPTVGQTLTGLTSAATGVIVAIGSTYLVLTKLVGSFTNTEVVKVGATTIGTAVPTTIVLSAKTSAQYTALAMDSYRSDIAVVPGSGPVRGVFSMINAGVDEFFAFRDNAGATATLLYKASASGWTVVGYLYEISFTAGAVAVPADGATLTQGGVTATVKRVMLQTGAWTGAGTGRFVITAPTGGNFAAGAATLTGGATCTLSGIQTAITMTVGGKFEFDLGNFSGQSSTIRIYGCDGVNRGFEFDGVTLAPIETGTASDNPTHLKIHKQHLFFSFRSSAIHSGPGLPYKWTAADGASEIGCGDTVTNFLNQPGSASSAALGITTITNTSILYGTGLSSWNLVPFNTGIGGVAFSARLLNESYWLDDPGVVNLATTLNFGNFLQSTITNNIPNFITEEKTKLAYAVLNRGKNQYRLLYNDGNGLYITIVNGKVYGMLKVNYTDAMYCAWDGLTSTAGERVFCGAASSGYVYEMDKGPSFDGQAINAYLTFNYNNFGSPRVIKRFRRASLEISGNFYASVAFGYSLGYASNELIQPSTVSYDTGVSAVPLWDTFVWDSFYWDGSTVSPTEVAVEGSGVNLQNSISCGTNYIQPFTISSIIHHFTPRRGVR